MCGDVRMQCNYCGHWIVQCPQYMCDDVIKWKHFTRYWPFVRGIHRSPVNSPHKGRWCGALIFSLTFAWIYGWVNNREASELRRHRAHYDVIVMDIRYPQRNDSDDKIETKLPVSSSQRKAMPDKCFIVCSSPAKVCIRSHRRMSGCRNMKLPQIYMLWKAMLI